MFLSAMGARQASDPAADRVEPSRLERWLCGLAILAGLIGALAFWGARASLWEDEIIAITHGLQPLPSFMVEMLRNDIHPFVWFLALKGWSALAPASDRWALASSVLFALASAWTVYRVARHHGGAHAALWGVALYAVQPTFAWAAGTLRMYSLVPLLAVCCWHLGRQLLRQGSWRRGALLVLVQLLLAYTHAIEFLFVGLIALNALWLEWDKTDRAARWRWAGWQALTVLAILPLPLSALARGTEPLLGSELYALIHYPSALVAGWPLENRPLFLILGGAVFAALVALSLPSREGRRLMLGIPVLGLVAAFAIGLFGKPLFKSPVFAANLLPFLAIAAGQGIAAMRAPAGRAGAALLLLFLAGATVPWSQHGLPKENYAPVGHTLAVFARPGDVVVAPNVSVYWGVLRYAADARWGRPLETLPPDNAAWQALKRKLGPAWTRRLSLEPTSDRVVIRGITYIVGEPRDVAVPAGGSVWLVQRARYASVIGLAEPARRVQTQWFGGELSLQQLQADPQGTTRYANPARP